MFGSKKRQQKAGSPSDKPEQRDRLGSALFKILGPANVDGAIQGHSPEARKAWKDFLENQKRERDEARRQKEEGRNSPVV
jgi:hypothetical protein